MSCQDLREMFIEFKRGAIEAARAQELEAHLAGCFDCQCWVEDDRALQRLFAERLPRRPAPIHLRREILRAAAPSRGWAGWWTPAVASAATALLVVLLLLPALPRSQVDPMQRMVRAVVAEHTRNLLWGEDRPDTVSTALPRLMEETGIGLSWFFFGDDEVRLRGVTPIYVNGKKGLALSYQDPNGHMVTYLVLPAQGLPVPERGRVQIDRFRPLLTRANGFSLFVWKQQDLTCFLISDLVSDYDLSRFREVFLKVRLTTEPFPIQ
jgi:hypothetical protein